MDSRGPVSILLCAAAGALAPSVARASRAYVATSCTVTAACGVPSGISVIDRTTHTVARTLIGGVGAAFVTLTPDGKTAYVSNEGEYSISVIDTASGAQTASIPIPAIGGEDMGPYSSILSPDGSRLYTLATYPSYPTYLVAIDTATNAVLFYDSVDATPSLPMAISADGQQLYLCAGEISIFDAATRKVVETVPGISGPLGPSGFAVSPNGAYAIVTANLSAGANGRFAMVDLNTQTMVKEIDFEVGEWTGPAVFSPDGALAYLAVNEKSSNQMEVMVFDVASRTIVATYAAGTGGATVMAVTPDGSEIDVGNAADNSVTALDAATGAAIAKTGTLGLLESVTASPDGRWIYAPGYESAMVQAIELDTGQIVGQIPAGYIDTYQDAQLKTSLDGALTAVSGASSLTIIDNARQQVRGIVPMPYPENFALSADGELAYVVTSHPEERILKVDTQLAKVVAEGILPAGDSGSYVALSPDGKTLYLSGTACAANRACGTGIVLVDTGTLSATGTIAMDACDLVDAIEVTREGSTAYVGCYVSPSKINVTIVDLAQRQVTGTVAVSPGNAPTALALAPDQKLLYAAYALGRYVDVISTQEQKLVTSLFGLVEPGQIAVSPDSALVYVTGAAFHAPMTVIAVPHGGAPYISGTIAMPAPSTGVAFVLNP